jgi:hypothetical protein
MRSWVNSALPWQTSNKKLHRHDDGDDQGTSPGSQGGSWAYPSRPRLVVAPGGNDGDDDVILGVSRQATGFRVLLVLQRRIQVEEHDNPKDIPAQDQCLPGGEFCLPSGLFELAVFLQTLFLTLFLAPLSR